jgi:hypothetical protein
LRAPLSLWALGLLATGCPNPNTYGTPRTVAPGKVSHTIAAEWVGWRFQARTPTDPTNPTSPDSEAEVTESGNVIVPPTYMLRLGVSDRVDLGFRASNMTTLGADVKYNFVRSEGFDLAIDPGVQWFALGLNTYHLHLPLLVGVNLSEAVTFMLTPGVMYGISTIKTGSDEADSALDRLLSTEGLYGRLGVGVNFRITRSFALHPEVTFLRSFSKAAEDAPVSGAMSYMFGLGFNFGSLPEYGAPPKE